MLPDELQLKLGITRGPFSVMEQLNSLKLRLHGLVLAKLLGGVDLHGEIEWVMWWANAEQPQRVERRLVPTTVEERDDAMSLTQKSTSNF